MSNQEDMLTLMQELMRFVDTVEEQLFFSTSKEAKLATGQGISIKDKHRVFHHPRSSLLAFCRFLHHSGKYQLKREQIDLGSETTVKLIYRFEKKCAFRK